MPSLNKVIFMGNLTRDPELKFLPSKAAMCKFGLAMNSTWNDKDGNKKEEVCFVDVTMFGKGAEVVNKHFTKGKPIIVEGRLKLEQWENSEGEKKSKHCVVADRFSFVPTQREQGGKHEQGPPQDDDIPF